MKCNKTIYKPKNIYFTDQFKKFANNCQDLLFEGIYIPTVYVLGNKRQNCDFKGKYFGRKNLFF